MSLNTLMTPLECEVLMQCYSLANAGDIVTAEAQFQAVLKFEKMGVVMTTGDDEIETITMTDLGRAWLTSILNTAVPMQIYVDEYGKEIKL